MSVKHVKSWAVTAPMLAALLAGHALAQEPSQRPEREEMPSSMQKSSMQNLQSVQLVQHDEIVGKEIVLQSGADRMAGGAEAETLGSINELVLDARTGKIRYAVVEPGEALENVDHKIALDWSKLRWDPKEERFTSAMTKDECGKLSPFDPEAMGRSAVSGLEKTGEEAREEAREAGREVAREVGEPAPPGGATRPSDSNVLVSKVADAEVWAQAEEIGSVDKLFVDVGSGTVALATVSSGGVLGIGDTTYVLPWSALRLADPTGDQEVRLHVDKTKSSLENAPKLEDDADVKDPAFRNRLYSFYGVQPPSFEKGSDRGMEPHTDRQNKEGGRGGDHK